VVSLRVTASQLVYPAGDVRDAPGVEGVEGLRLVHLPLLLLGQGTNLPASLRQKLTIIGVSVPVGPERY
jgi:hypothetical protein